MCFQEVTKTFVDVARAIPWITAEYLSSDPELDGSTINSYGTLTLAKRNLFPTFERTDFPSYMGRDLLIARISLEEGCEVHVGNVHLESLDSQFIREKQLLVCSEKLPVGRSVLCGDFNFCSERNFIDDGRPLNNDCLSRIIPRYTDLWSTLRPSEHGYTFDSVTNSVIGKFEQSRYDRVMASIDSISIHPRSIELIGTVPIRKSSSTAASVSSSADVMSTPPRRDAEEPDLFASDHFGLYTVFG